MRTTGMARLVGATLIATGLAHAEPSAPARHFSASLEYVVPSRCPGGESFKSAVTGRLGFDPFSREASAHVLVTILANERPLEGRLEWRNAQGDWAGDRVFPAQNDDCDELTRAMALALAVQIHLLQVGEAPEGSGALTPAGGVGATPAPAPPPAPASKPASSDIEAGGDQAAKPSDAAASAAAWSLAVGGGGALALGMSPGPTVLGRLFGSLAYGFVSFELGGELSSETSEERADGAGFTQRAMLASVAACGAQGPWSLCAVAKGGVLKVAGQEIDVPVSSDALAFQAGLRFAARERLGKSAFFGQRLEGLANVTRWTVTLDRIPVWTAPPVAGTLGVDVGVIFE